MSTTLEPTLEKTQKKGVPAFPRPAQPAYIIKNDAEAITIAEQLAADFAKGSAEPDNTRPCPIKELDTFSKSGFWPNNFPKKFGEPKFSTPILAKVVKIISPPAPPMGQIWLYPRPAAPWAKSAAS